MEKLKKENVLLVKQKKEWGEILTGFETKNKYSIMDSSGRQIYFAAEKSSFLARMFLHNMRPFTIHIINAEKKAILRLKRVFRFIFHEIHINDTNEKKLGWIKKKFKIFSRQFVVFDSSDQIIFEIYGPLFHPWTFRILKEGKEVGKISKKWSGLGKEIFTDADNFNISFPEGIDVNQKSILLGALFLIDILFFEKSKN